MLKGVILDGNSLGPGDLDMSPITGLEGIDWTFFDATQPGETAARIADADIVLTNKVVLGAGEIATAPKLKYIGVLATGTNIVDRDAVRQRGIEVHNVVGYGTNSVVQHTFALILALTTKLREYNRAALDGSWGKSPFFCLLDYPVTELAGKTLGIVGYGELGRGVGNIGRAFGMTVVAASLRERPDDDEVSRLPLETLLATADVVSIHCPLNERTRNLIGARELAVMKPSALLINCARGGIVNEPALAAALRQGDIAGAGIDVLSEEPPVHGNSLLAPDIPNLIVTPHCAWLARESRQRLVDATGRQLAEFLRCR